MTWKRAERVVWAVSGVSLVVALVLFVQHRGERLTMLFVVISLGISYLFDLVKRTRRGTDADRPAGHSTN